MDWHSAGASADYIDLRGKGLPPRLPAREASASPSGAVSRDPTLRLRPGQAPSKTVMGGADSVVVAHRLPPTATPPS